MSHFIGKRLLALSIPALCAILPSNAQNAVKMTQADGENTVFLLNSHPSVSIDGSEIIVETDQDKVTYVIGEGVTFEFIDYNSNSVENVTDRIPVFKVSPQSIEASGLTPGKMVSLYDASGKLLISASTDPNGNVTLEISHLPSGIYIFNSSDKNFKYYKK